MSNKTLTNIADIAYETSIDEFKKVLTGFDSDFDKLTSKSTGVFNFKIGEKITNSLSNSDAKILNRLLGTISGGYYLRDMMTGKALETSAIKTFIKDIFKKDSDKTVENESYYFYHESGKGSDKSNIKKLVKENGLPVSNYIADANKQNYITPSIGAVEFKKHTLSLAKRYGDSLSLFFNCISSLDMSLCTPYLDVKVLIPKNNTGKKSLGHEIQFRFVKGDSDKGLIAKGINKIKESIDLGFKKNDDEDLYDIHGMELFLSPQTLTNSNIRKEDKNILEPNTTLLTLKNCDISISGLGVGLFCSKNAKLSMTLHDRSRLRDIAPLITPKQFAKSRVIIEYGWSHPQGGITSDNVTGKFLNSLRDKGVFIVKGSSFSFTDGGHVDINVDLAMMGGSDSVVASVAAGGNYVQSNIFKEQIKDVIETIKKENSDAQSIENVISEKYLKISNSAGPNTLMKRSTYIELLKEIKNGNELAMKNILKKFLKELDESENINIAEAINDKIEQLPRGGINTSDPFLLGSYNNHKLQSYLFTQGDTDLNLEFTSLGSVLLEFVAYPLHATHQFDEVQMFFYPLNQSSAGGYIHTTASFPIEIESLKNIFVGDDPANTDMNNMSVSRFMNRLEKKIIRNPVYKHYGLNSEYELLNATKNITDQLIIDYYDSTEKQNKNKDFSAIELFLAMNSTNKSSYDKLYDSLRYQQVLKSKYDAGLLDEKSYKELKGHSDNLNELNNAIDTSSLKEELLRAIKKNINSKLEQIYSTYGIDYIENDSHSYSRESKFCMPNLSYFFETINPHENDPTSFKDLKEQFLKSNSVIKENKSILRIHVYDEEAIADKSQELLLSICNNRKVIDAVTENKLEIFENLRNNNSKGGILSKIFGKDKLTKKVGNSIINNLDFNEVKDIIKHTMPSITIGSNCSNVKSFSANSTTSGEISNVLFITEQVKQKNINNNNSKIPALDFMDDLVVIPAVGSLNCSGMPLLQRGQQFFIDAGTGTSIDAIYTVQSVNHNISQGGFNTTARLIYSGQNRVESIREMIGKIIPE